MAVDYGRIAWKNITEMGRGGACVPARVALQGRIRRSIPRTQCVCFWYGNAAARTFGRAHRHRPYHSNTCRQAASPKPKVFLLAVTLQALKRKKQCSQ